MAIWWVFNGYLMGFFHRNLVGMSASMAILCLVGAKKEEFRYYGIFIAFVQIHEILGNIVLPTMRWNDVSYFWDKSIWWDWGLVSTKHNLIIYYNYNMAMGSNTFFWALPWFDCHRATPKLAAPGSFNWEPFWQHARVTTSPFHPSMGGSSVRAPREAITHRETKC